mgnify:CR=1 FL=1
MILFDEVEKAHPDVFNVLLQVLDDGRLTDGQGRTVDFRNTLIVLTSNLGSEASGELAGKGRRLGRRGRGDGRGARRVPARVPQPARRDPAVPPPVARRHEGDRRRSSCERLRKLLADRKITLEVDAAASAWLANAGYDPVYGARPLKRVIQRELQNPLAAADPRRPYPRRARRSMSAPATRGLVDRRDRDRRSGLAAPPPSPLPDFRPQVAAQGSAQSDRRPAIRRAKRWRRRPFGPGGIAARWPEPALRTPPPPRGDREPVRRSSRRRRSAPSGIAASSTAAASPSAKAPASARPAAGRPEHWRSKAETAARALSSARWRSVRQIAWCFGPRDSRQAERQRSAAWAASNAVSRRSKSLASIARTWASTTLATCGPSPGVMARFGHRRRDRRHRVGDIGYVRDRRQIEMHGTVATRCDDPIEAEPQRQGIPVEGEGHGLAGQRLGFAVEQCSRRSRRMVCPRGRRLGPSRMPAGGALRLIQAMVRLLASSSRRNASGGWLSLLI